MKSCLCRKKTKWRRTDLLKGVARSIPPLKGGGPCFLAMNFLFISVLCGHLIITDSYLCPWGKPSNFQPPSYGHPLMRTTDTCLKNNTICAPRRRGLGLFCPINTSVFLFIVYTRFRNSIKLSIENIRSCTAAQYMRSVRVLFKSEIYR